MNLRPWLAGLLAAATALAALPSSANDSYPSKPIKLVVPYPPGGGIDPTARIYAQALADEMRATVVVQNTGGASGQIGTEQVANSPPDGYTLLFASAAPNAILPAAKSKLPYSPKDFAPIALIASSPYVLVANPSVQAANLQELLQAIRRRPDYVASFGSSGPLSGPHLAGELFKMLTKAQMTHVPFRGNGPAVMAVLGGEVPLTFASAPAVMQHVKSGKLKVYGISATERAPSMPDVPALGETLPGLEVAQWYGLMAPAGTPADIVDKLAQATARVLASSTVKSKFAHHGLESRTTRSPADFGRFVEEDIRKYHELIRAGNIPLD